MAKYCQWDGYPEGVGANILDFLNNKEKMEQLKKRLDDIEFIDEDEIAGNEFVRKYELAASRNKRSKKQVKWFNELHSREVGGNIFDKIIEQPPGKITLLSCGIEHRDFSWIEWSYLINLQEQTFTVFKGEIWKTPIYTFSLSMLPENGETLANFLANMEED